MNPVPVEASEKKGPCKVAILFGKIDLNTSVHFTSDIISNKSGVFDQARQVKSSH